LLPIALCLSGAVALLPVAASADGVTLAVGSTAQLVAGVEVDVPITVNCAPLPPPSSSGMSSFVIEEAVGESIAFGSGIPPPLTCDGTDHSAVVKVIANTSGPPFRRGKAVVTIAVVQLCENSPPFACESASVGPQTITIKR